MRDLLQIGRKELHSQSRENIYYNAGLNLKRVSLRKITIRFWTKYHFLIVILWQS